MDGKRQAYDEQAALWNGAAGQGWVTAQHVLDRMFEPMEALLVQAVRDSGGTEVLDVGCGTGATTLAVARDLGERGRCTGIDLSEPMIEAARHRAKREGATARFLCADAQRYAFPRASFDTVISRIGVMFFDDPVAAFANLRRAARDGAALRFIAWRGADENRFMTTAEKAAAPLLPALPARASDGPGQFAFADADKVGGILSAAGWAGIGIRAVDLACTFPASELQRYVTSVGPLGRVFGTLDANVRDTVVATVLRAFAPYVDGGEVRLTSACWMVEATAGAREEHGHA
ncbi:class I SAM-dependent methyltransferase [Cupriavidus sp. JZ107]